MSTDAKHPAYLDDPARFHLLLVSLVERAATTRRNTALRAEAVQEMEADSGKPVVEIALVRLMHNEPTSHQSELFHSLLVANRRSRCGIEALD